MNTFQELLRNTNYEGAVLPNKRSDKLKNLYDALVAFPVFEMRKDYVFLVSEYVSWTDLNEVTYTSSLYAAEGGKLKMPATTPWEELLSYRVSEVSIECYGLPTVLTAIMEDMTFFGATQEEANTRTEEFDNIVRDMMSNDELWESLKENPDPEVANHEMTEAEVAFADNANCRNAGIYQCQVSAVVTQLKHEN